LRGTFAAQLGNLNTLRLRTGISRASDRIARSVGILGTTSGLCTSTLLSLRSRLLGLLLCALLTATARLWHSCWHIVALLTSTSAGILILLADDFAVANVFIARKLEIADHSLLGFLFRLLG